MALIFSIYLTILLTSSLFPPTTLASPQLCYYDTNALASEDIIPCYASITQVEYPCCKFGDKCLRHNACFSPDTDVTYQYGCTDPTYRDVSCPQKCGLDTQKSHWAGLVFCNGQNNTPSDTWVCHHPDNCGSKQDCAKGSWDDGVEKLQDTTCGDVRYEGSYVAFRESSTLSDVVPLPVRTELAGWWVEHADRTRVGLTSTSALTSIPARTLATASDSSLSIVTTEANTSISSTPEATQTSPTQMPRKVATLALGLAIGFGLPIVITLVSATIYLLRRQKKKHEAALAALTESSSRGSDDKSETAASTGNEAGLDASLAFESPETVHE